MTSLRTVENSILAEVVAVTTGLFFDNLPIKVMAAIGWPPEKVLQENVRGSTSVVSVYDRKMAKNSTRWKPIVISTSTTPATLTSELSNSTLAAGTVGTLTLGGSVTAGDAVSLVVTNSSLGVTVTFSGATIENTKAQIVTGGATDTPASLAEALILAINADPVISTWLSASASGPIITLTSLISLGTLTLQSNVGNGGVNTREIGRRDRSFQVVIWSPTADIRSTVTSAIETLLQQLEINFIEFSDGSGGRLFNQNDFDLEDATLADTYRHDFIFSVDYAITELDALYAVLAQIQDFAVE